MTLIQRQEGFDQLEQYRILSPNTSNIWEFIARIKLNVDGIKSKPYNRNITEEEILTNELTLCKDLIEECLEDIEYVINLFSGNTLGNNDIEQLFKFSLGIKELFLIPFEEWTKENIETFLISYADYIRIKDYWNNNSNQRQYYEKLELSKISNIEALIEKMPDIYGKLLYVADGHFTMQSSGGKLPDSVKEQI